MQPAGWQFVMTDWQTCILQTHNFAPHEGIRGQPDRRTQSDAYEPTMHKHRFAQKLPVQYSPSCSFILVYYMVLQSISTNVHEAFLLGSP